VIGDIAQQPTHWWVIIIVATIAAIPSTIGAWASFKAKNHSAAAAEQSTEVNDAVNHRHRDGGATPRIYDAVLKSMEDISDLKDWKARWDDLPLDLFADNGLTNKLDKIDKALVKNDQDHEKIFRRLDAMIHSESPERKEV
jgi:hypothetical protein